MYAQQNQIGAPPVNNFYDADTTQRYPLGYQMSGIDPYWGPAEFIYGKAGGAIRQYGLVICAPVFNSTTGVWDEVFSEVPNTANLGRSLYVSQGALADGEFGWFMRSGLCPVNCNASVAANTTFGIAAAGQGGANAAGKQILGGRVIAAATTTVVRAGTAANGSKILVVKDASGWFPGVYLSGTGVAAGATVESIGPDNRTVVMSAASTAAIDGNVTATYNNATIFYNVAHLDRPIAQGAIT